MSDTPRITITPDGPYAVRGNLPIIEQTIVPDEEDESVAWKQTGSFEGGDEVYLCRCGHSGSKPFCDGSHERVGFDGAETAGHEPFADAAKRLPGPRYTLLDREDLCAFARFCDTHQTAWREVERTDDPKVADIFLGQVNRCVSGRLVAVDSNTGEVIEPQREKRISTVQDPGENCSGPLYVEGAVALTGSDGTEYEPRQRMALCRCGQSGNKPFCDGTHARIGFDDGRQ